MSQRQSRITTFKKIVFGIWSFRIICIWLRILFFIYIPDEPQGKSFIFFWKILWNFSLWAIDNMIFPVSNSTWDGQQRNCFGEVLRMGKHDNLVLEKRIIFPLLLFSLPSSQLCLHKAMTHPLYGSMWTNLPLYLYYNYIQTACLQLPGKIRKLL